MNATNASGNQHSSDEVGSAIFSDDRFSPSGNSCGSKATTRRSKRGARRVGRPTKLTAALTAEVAKHLRQGNYVETAAALAGISKTTLYLFLRNGARLRGMIDSTPSTTLTREELLLVEFSITVLAASAQAEANGVNCIAEAARRGEWRAQAWLLERRHPKRWRLTESGESDCAEGKAIDACDATTDLMKLSNAELERIAYGAYDGNGGEDGLPSQQPTTRLLAPPDSLSSDAHATPIL